MRENSNVPSSSPAEKRPLTTSPWMAPSITYARVLPSGRRPSPSSRSARVLESNVPLRTAERTASPFPRQKTVPDTVSFPSNWRSK